MLNLFERTLRDESGASMVEYAILVSLIAAVCIVIVRAVGMKTSGLFSSANTAMGP